MEKYVNNLKNYSLKRENIGCDFDEIGGTKRKTFLSIPTGFNKEINNQIKEFNKVLEYYSDYINDLEALLKIWDKMESVQYINTGCREVDGWEANRHIFIINGYSFDYATGTCIDCHIYKLLFDCICCLLDEANIMKYTPTVGEFLHEFCYDENIKQIRKGEKAFAHIQENKEKLLKIFSREDIENIREYIEL